MTTASGTFTVSAWDENTYLELADNAKLTKATVSFAFSGELSGEATWDAVMCYRPDGTASYTGMQRMTGQLGGVDGTFVVQADGEFIDGEARSQWHVVDGSGTGGLARLTGSGSAVATSTPPGSFTFDYDLG